MAEERPSAGTFILVLAAVGLLAVSMALPWFTYDWSSGRQTAPGGFNDPDNTQVERHSLTYGPAFQTGDVQPTHPDEARQALQYLSWALWAGIGLLALAALGEVPPLARWMPRWTSLTVLGLSAATAGAAIYIGWFLLPATLDGYGVTGPFTAFLADGGYTRTSLQLGWAAAAAAIPLTVGAFMWKFQAGSDDLSLPGAQSASHRRST